MSELEEITVQQFAFADSDDDDTTFSEEMWYHCEVIFEVCYLFEIINYLIYTV